MTYERAIHGSLGIGAVMALAWACAGSGTPERTAEFDQAIAAAYAGSQGLPAGGSGPGGGGSGPSGGDGGANDGGSAGADNQAGSGEPPPGGSGPSGSVCNAPEQIFFTTCGGDDNFCHGSDSLNGNFGASAAAAEALVDEVSFNGPSCGLLIDSSDPESSLILTKVTDEFDRDDCPGSPMPLGETELLPEEDVDCIRSWLSQFEE